MIRLLFVLLIFSFEAQGQIQMDDDWEKSIINETQMVFFQDSDKVLSPSQVAEKLLKGQFYPVTLPVKQRVHNWFALEVDHRSSKPVLYHQEVLSTIYTEIYWIDKDSGSVRSLARGPYDSEPSLSSENRIRSNLSSFSLNIPRGRGYLLFKCFHTNSNGAFVFSLRNLKNYHSNQSLKIAVMALALGCVFLMGVYNLFYFVQLGSRSHFYYSFYALASGIYLMISPMGMIGYLNITANQAMKFVSVAVSAQGIFSWLLIGSLLNYRKRAWSRWASVFALTFYISTIVLEFISPELSKDIKNLGAPLIILVSLLTILVVGILDRKVTAGLILLGWSPWILSIGRVAGFFAGNRLVSLESIQFSLPAALVWEVVTFSAVLAEFIRQERLENFRKVERLNTKLQDFNENLENIVREKTAKISSIMKNVEIGIFTVDEQMKVGTEYTEHLEEVLEEKDLANQSFVQTFLEKLDFDADRKNQIQEFVNASIGQDDLSFMMNQHLAPLEACINLPSGKKILQTSWSTILQDNMVQKILVSIKDMTEQRASELEAQAAGRELQIIRSILGISTAQFERFVENAVTFIAQNEELIRKNNHLDQEVVKILFINMHTLKGAARSYEFREMTGTIHEVEQTYASLQRKEIVWDQSMLLEELGRVKALIDEYEYVYTEKLQRRRIRGQTIIDLSLLKRVYVLLGSSDFRKMLESHPAVRDAEKGLFERVGDIYFMDVQTILQESLDGLPTLAKDLSKEIPSIVFEGDRRGIDQDGMDVIRNAFVHIIRNSMDHGIEEPGAREVLGKPKAGTLTFILRNVADGLEIEFFDDGQGLDLRKIHQIAIDRNLVERSSDLDTQSIAELILHSGFSTASQISDISGRGVGMDAVKTYLTDAGGSLEIVLKEKSPLTGNTHFSLWIKVPQKYLSLLEPVQKAA